MSKDNKEMKNEKDTAIIVLQKTLAEMRRELEALKNQQNEPARIARDGVVIVTQEEVRRFLDAPVRENVFWAETPAPVLCLRGDEKTWDKDLRKENTSQCFFAPFSRSFGVGEELRRDDGRLIYPYGIGRYELAPETPDYEVLVKRLTARTQSGDTPRIYSDAEWREMMRAEYEGRAAKQAVQDKYKRRMAELATGKAEGDPKLGA